MTVDRRIVLVAKTVNCESLQWLATLVSPSTPVSIVTPRKPPLSLPVGVDVICDDALLNRPRALDILSCTRRPSWYYQQVLKYRAIEFFPERFIHIVDGDTFLASDVLDSRFFYTTGKRAHAPYRVFIDELLGSGGGCVHSYVTNQMLFDKKAYVSMMERIGCPNASSLLTLISARIGSRSDAEFSEYQLYSDYCQRTGAYRKPTKRIKVFRRYDLVGGAFERGISKYSVIALECHHRTTFMRWLRARLYYFLGISLG